jgi:hypothetical protein
VTEVEIDSRAASQITIPGKNLILDKMEKQRLE